MGKLGSLWEISGEAFVDGVGDGANIGDAESIFEEPAGEVEVKFLGFPKGEGPFDSLPFFSDLGGGVEVLNDEFF